jgi:hypothetical protein
MAATRSRPGAALAGIPDAMENDMKFPQQDSGVPATTPERDPDPARPARSAPTDPDAAAAGAGPDPSPSIQSGIPSEGVSESTPGDGL